MQVYDMPRQWLDDHHHSWSGWIFAVVVVVVTLWCVVAPYPSPTTTSNDVLSSPTHTCHATTTSVPFIAMNQIDWNVIRRSLDSYRIETKNLLERLSMTLEVVEAEENQMGRLGWKLSNVIRTKIRRLSDLYDSDFEILEQLLLVPFPTVHVLPLPTVPAMSTVAAMSHTIDDEHDSLKSLDDAMNFTWWHSSDRQTLEKQQQPYDSVRQVMAHLVRDWSHIEGAPIRASIYDWCIEQLRMYNYTANQGPVLVPGAGLGRLAWDIGTVLHCSVEAMECSVCMAAAAYAILHHSFKSVHGFELHPFAADLFSNEVDHEARYDSIHFPYVDPTWHGNGSLSYTVGNFSNEAMLHCTNFYAAIVTSFFVDTATTVYDFVSTVAMILSDGGIWINVGPLQWHINNQVPVAVDEFLMILEHFHNTTTGKKTFDILHWSVDNEPVRYRNQGGRHRSTHFDAYCPLRFVIRKRSV
jgi:N2227-like protein